MPDPQTQTVGTVCVAEGSKHECKCPSGRSLQTNPNAFDNAHQHLEREFVQSLVQDSPIQDWSVTTFLRYDEVRLSDSVSLLPPGFRHQCNEVDRYGKKEAGTGEHLTL